MLLSSYLDVLIEKIEAPLLSCQDWDGVANSDLPQPNWNSASQMRRYTVDKTLEKGLEQDYYPACETNPAVLMLKTKVKIS